MKINWNNPSDKISEFFSVGEVTKGDARRVPTNPEHRKNILALAVELDKIRKEWGSAIRVTSWYRPPAVNRAVGGVSNSQHITGNAVDIVPANGKLLEFERWLDQHWSGALGYGGRSRRGFVHIDMRNGKGWKDGAPKGVRWNY